MEFTGRYFIAAPQETVWAGLNDAEVLKACIPGCEAIEKPGNLGAMLRTAEAARAALGNFKVSALAVESGGLIRIVQERRFSWTGLFARLERAV